MSLLNFAPDLTIRQDSDLASIYSTASYGLTNGGLAGLVQMYLIAVIGFGTAILSMAEMASL